MAMPGEGGERMSDYIYLTYYDGLMVITGAMKGIGIYKQSRTSQV